MAEVSSTPDDDVMMTLKKLKKLIILLTILLTVAYIKLCNKSEPLVIYPTDNPVNNKVSPVKDKKPVKSDITNNKNISNSRAKTSLKAPLKILLLSSTPRSGSTYLSDLLTPSGTLAFNYFEPLRLLT